MATKTKAKKKYNVQMHVNVLADVEIEANNLEEAVLMAKDIGWQEVVNLNDGTYIDGQVKAVGVYRSDNFDLVTVEN